MNKIIFTLLIFPITISAQKYDPYLSNDEYDIFQIDCPEYTYENNQYPFYVECRFKQSYYRFNFHESPNDLDLFADFFFRSLETSYMVRYPNEKRLNLNRNKINFTFQSFNDQRIAIAKSMGDSNYEIVVDPIKWNRALIAEKVWIIFHELAHEIFSTRHGQAGGMMFPISAGDNISLNRLTNGWVALADWLVENKKRQIKSLHEEFEWDD